METTHKNWNENDPRIDLKTWKSPDLSEFGNLSCPLCTAEFEPKRWIRIERRMGLGMLRK